MRASGARRDAKCAALVKLRLIVVAADDDDDDEEAARHSQRQTYERGAWASH